MENNNPYILLTERIKILVPNCKIEIGMSFKDVYDEINRCFDEIEKMTR